MSRISIDVTPAQHQRLKAMAALQGMSIKEFVLANTLGAHGDDLAELEALLDRRIQRATEAPSARSAEEVFQEAREKARRRRDA